MDYHPFKAMLNRYFSRYVGGAQRPIFFDIDQTCPSLNVVTQHYHTIRNECARLLGERARMPQYHEIDPGEAAISGIINPEKQWKVFMLYILGYKPEANRARCPETCRVLDCVPEMTQAFFSVLEPGKSIPLHEGPYLGYLRYHLGLLVPAENPPILVVNGQEYVWKAGEAVLFDDSWPHEVINTSRADRVVLIVDVLRPLPWLPSLVNKLVMYGLAGPTYGRSVARRAQRAGTVNVD
ncbi:aspartyl/asparaginyl beta-hydroxylase domain-containing protein [Nitrospira sp. Kam-Ns4a]